LGYGLVKRIHFKRDISGYSVYDKPLFQGSSASNIYRPKKNLDDEIYGGPSGEKEMDRIMKADRFEGDRQFARKFQGTEAGESASRDGPVQFEKDTLSFSSSRPSGSDAKASDPFGLDQFLSAAKSGKKRTGNDDSEQQDKRRRA
jgi:SNW domain-containing protein 1